MFSHFLPGGFIDPIGGPSWRVNDFDSKIGIHWPEGLLDVILNGICGGATRIRWSKCNDDRSFIVNRAASDHAQLRYAEKGEFGIHHAIERLLDAAQPVVYHCAPG